MSIKRNVEYIIVEENVSYQLAARVTERLKDGWQLYGDPFTWIDDTGDRHYVIFCQALTYEPGSFS